MRPGLFLLAAVSVLASPLASAAERQTVEQVHRVHDPDDGTAAPEKVVKTRATRHVDANGAKVVGRRAQVVEKGPGGQEKRTVAEHHTVVRRPGASAPVAHPRAGVPQADARPVAHGGVRGVAPSGPRAKPVAAPVATPVHDPAGAKPVAHAGAVPHPVGQTPIQHAPLHGARPTVAAGPRVGSAGPNKPVIAAPVAVPSAGSSTSASASTGPKGTSSSLGSSLTPLILPSVSALSGLFTYGPMLGTHSDYAGQQDVKVAKRDLPDRAVDRGGSLAVGLRGGGYWSSTPDASAIYADPGAGLLVRYRPLEFLGLEGGLTHNEGSAGLDAGVAPRTDTLATGSLQLFAFPWSRVSPFVSGGIGYDDRNLHLLGAADSSGKPDKALWGPQGGLGVELSIGQSLAFDLDARLNDYVNAADVGAVPLAVTTNLGMLFHF